MEIIAHKTFSYTPGQRLPLELPGSVVGYAFSGVVHSVVVEEGDTLLAVAQEFERLGLRNAGRFYDSSVSVEDLVKQNPALSPDQRLRQGERVRYNRVDHVAVGLHYVM